MEGPASDGETAPWCVPRRCSCSGQGDEAVRSASGTFGDAAEVRHHHQTKSDGAAGKVIAAGRLRRSVPDLSAETARFGCAVPGKAGSSVMEVEPTSVSSRL